MDLSDALALLGVVGIALLFYKGFRAATRTPPREGPPERILG